MREEEAGTRYLSPLVKQDLAKLNSDGESRRLALKSLKQFIEQLDATSMPKFLTQIAESREPGGSRSYAISLYEEVARVHRKLIKPHLPRVMSSLIRALAASGSSPQMQQACAKVTAAMARYTVDPTMCIEDAEDIIRDICDPLAEALAGKLEPVAAGAAACIHALIETDNWKYACDETVQKVCQRTSVALGERSTRTVFHLQLASALASMNPDTLGLHGATILRAGGEILKTAVDSWQHRKAAAKLLQGMLTILDKETLENEVDLAIHALESCRLDKMPHVRAAVSEALYAAKMLASGDATQSCGMLSGPLSKSICKSVEQSHSSWTKGDIEQSPNPWIKGDVSSSLVLQKRIVSPTSQESNQLSFSPASTSTMESMHISIPARRSNSRRSNRTPLYPASDMGFTRSSGYNSPGKFSPSGSSTDIELDAKENRPARMTSMNGALPNEEFGHVEIQANVIILQTPTPSQQLDHKFGVDIHASESKDQYFAENLADRSGPHAGKEASKVSNSMISRHVMSPMVSAILDELTETASSILAEDDAGLALLDSQIEEACNLKSEFKHVVLPRLRLGNINSSDSLPKSGYTAGGRNSKHSFSCITNQSNEKSPSGANVWNASGCVERGVKLETRVKNLIGTDTTGDFAPGFQGSDHNPLRGSDSLAHLYFSPEKSKPLEDTYDSTLDCVPSNMTTPISTQAQDCIEFDNTYSILGANIHRSISSEVGTYIPIVEGSDYLDTVEHISGGAAGFDEVKKNGLGSNCQASSEGYPMVQCCGLKSSERNSQRWWDIRGLGRYMLVQLASRNCRHLCWYGEILLGGTLCVVLTLPLAMAFAKALTSCPDYLVPT